MSQKVPAQPTGPVYILDLDGTMLPSAAIDNSCFWEAVNRVFGNEHGALDLREFEHVTDTGILREWHLKHFGRAPSNRQTERVKSDFLDAIRRAADEKPTCFRPRRGLEDWLRDTLSHDPHGVAIATGGWAHTARLKLARAGLDRFELPLASSDDAISRCAIMRTALARLESERPTLARRQIIYIGDGPWDFHASRELGWGFIGVGSGQERRSLLEAGAPRVIPDFRGLAPNSPK